MKRRLYSSLALSLVTTSVALAHPGHGADGGNHSLWHYLTEPLHLMAAAALFVLAAGLAGAAFTIFRKRDRAAAVEEPTCPQ